MNVSIIAIQSCIVIIHSIKRCTHVAQIHCKFSLQNIFQLHPWICVHGASLNSSGKCLVGIFLTAKYLELAEHDVIYL